MTKSAVLQLEPNAKGDPGDAVGGGGAAEAPKLLGPRRPTPLLGDVEERL